MRVRIFADAGELARVAAGDFLTLARRCLDANGRFTVALSGGSTPRRLYRSLAEAAPPGIAAGFPWNEVHFFWGDERDVPPDHPESNYRMARESLLSRVDVAPGNVHRVPTHGGDAQAAATRYESEIRRFFDLSEGAWPRFDLVLLGMGPDGHTASLFPGSDAVQERTRLVVAPRVESLKSRRVTLTLPVLNRAAEVFFLVTGRDKAETLRLVLEGRPSTYPAQLVRPQDGKSTWYLDERAASSLSPDGGQKK